MRIGHAADGHRMTPADREATDQMVRETPTPPEPGELEKEISRWRRDPDTPALEQLRALPDAIDALEAEAQELAEKLTDAVLAGDADAEAEVLDEQARLQRRIAARLAAVATIAKRIPGEVAEALEAEVEQLQAERADARAEVEPRKAAYLQAKAQAEDRHAAWRAALTSSRALGEEISDRRRRIAKLRGEE